MKTACESIITTLEEHGAPPSYSDLVYSAVSDGHTKGCAKVAIHNLEKRRKILGVGPRGERKFTLIGEQCWADSPTSDTQGWCDDCIEFGNYEKCKKCGVPA